LRAGSQNNPQEKVMRIRTALFLVFACTFSIGALAQSKMSGTLQCKPAATPAPVEIGDHPNHAYVIATQTCTWSKPFEMAGLTSKDGKDTAVAEINGTDSIENGYHMGAMSNGDKYAVKFTGKSMTKDGKMSGGQGTWSFTEGTGKLKGLKGKGTYKGTPNADGSTTTEVTGEYSLPQQ
jgi:hypothetical protein